MTRPGRFCLPIAFILAFLAPPVAAQSDGSSDGDAIQIAPHDWPWWRGPNGNGVAAADQDPPVEWGEDKNILWKADIPGRGHASPIVVGDHVYLPTADHERNVQLVLCFDRHTGQRLWSTPVHTGGIMSGNRKASQASCTIACDGKRLFVNFLNDGAAWTTALTRDGKKLWQRGISDYVVHQGYGSSPALYKHLVIVSADNKGGGAIAAFDRATGEPAYRIERPKKPNYASPVIVRAAGRDQLVFIGCDLVSSFNPLTGDRYWQFDGATTECVSTTVTDGVHIYTSGGYPRNHIAAVVADGSGKVAWQNEERIYVPSMLVHEGYLYAAGDLGSAMCFKSDTGDVAWKEKLSRGFTSSPVLVAKRIYAIDEQGNAFVFNADPKAFKLLGKSKLGDEVLTSPAICGGRIYLRVAHQADEGRKEVLYCIGKAGK